MGIWESGKVGTGSAELLGLPRLSVVWVENVGLEPSGRPTLNSEHMQ